MNLGGGIDMDIGSLLNKLIENDKNGKIVNELIEQGILKVDDIVNYVCSTNDFSLIHYVSKYVKNADIGKLEDKILCISDFSLIFDYLKDVSNVSVSKFEDKFIESDNASNISYFSFLMIDRGINVLRLENRMGNVEEEVKELNNELDIIKNNKKEERVEKLFFNGEEYDAFSFLSNLVNKANNKIILIDNYIDVGTLDILSHKKSSVDVEIVTVHNYLTQSAMNNFVKQYGNLHIKYNTNFHDRFLIIDNTYLYLIGASIKDAGKKIFSINEMHDIDNLNFLLQKI